jgi:hypothetical protein
MGILAAALVCLGVLAAWPGGALAAGRITGLEVTRNGDTVHVSAHLSGGFPADVAKQIRNGVPKDLFYTVTMNRRHRRWFDEELFSRTVEYTIKFDTLEDRYHIRRTDPDGSQTETVVPDYDAALKMVSEIRDVTLTIPPESPESTHYVAVKAEMRAVRLPLYLDYVFFFIPIQEYETPWARSPSVESLR